MIIGVCTCCTEGHDDIAVDIDNSDDYVSWNVYYDNNPEKHKFYTFDKNDYTNAIEEATSKITQKEKFVFVEQNLLNKEKNEQTAKSLYPHEKWELLETGI